jgi:cell division protein FtsI/penicillin-binding protein 2
MRTIVLAAALGASVAALMPIEAHPRDPADAAPSYLLISAVTREVIDARWDERARPLAFGSLIKPFTALAYADTHRFTYPTLECHGSADGCWLPSGHGRIGLAAAIAGSCNAYFRQLAQQTSPDALAARLRSFGIQTDGMSATPAAMVGYGETLKLAPAALAGGYVELVSRASEPGVRPIVQGMRSSSLSGTGKGVGAAIGRAEALVKTGTAPCSHSPRAAADGYTVVVYPADRPRVVLLMQAHGRTGAETAVLAGRLLARASEVR